MSVLLKIAQRTSYFINSFVAFKLFNSSSSVINHNPKKNLIHRNSEKSKIQPCVMAELTVKGIIKKITKR